MTANENPVHLRRTGFARDMAPSQCQEVRRADPAAAGDDSVAELRRRVTLFDSVES